VFLMLQLLQVSKPNIIELNSVRYKYALAVILSDSCDLRKITHKNIEYSCENFSP